MTHENDAFIQTAIDVGEPLVCVHKGFPFQGWSRVHADPMPDMGAVAKRCPDVNFVIYHAAFDSGHEEGPYNEDPNPDDGGTDRLSKVITDNGLKNKNVFAEMGSAWAIAMRDPIQAQHYIGKMLKYLGEDRLVWGSECGWFGFPQNQVEALKAFRISAEFREKYDYPELTDSVRRKVFGLTGAKLYRVIQRRAATRCHATRWPRGSRSWTTAGAAAGTHTIRQSSERAASTSNCGASMSPAAKSAERLTAPHGRDVGARPRGGPPAERASCAAQRVVDCSVL